MLNSLQIRVLGQEVSVDKLAPGPWLNQDRPRTSDIYHQHLGPPRQGLLRPRKIGLLRAPHVQKDLSDARDAAGRHDQRPDTTDHRDVTHPSHTPPIGCARAPTIDWTSARLGRPPSPPALSS